LQRAREDPPHTHTHTHTHSSLTRDAVGAAVDAQQVGGNERDPSQEGEGGSRSGGGAGRDVWGPSVEDVGREEAAAVGGGLGDEDWSGRLRAWETQCQVKDAWDILNASLDTTFCDLVRYN
jgi:hypothetical protein